ncbi:hypothetical protein MTO96_051774 [Rhipicephalus appendiculatus]
MGTGQTFRAGELSGLLKRECPGRAGVQDGGMRTFALWATALLTMLSSSALLSRTTLLLPFATQASAKVMQQASLLRLELNIMER